MRIKFGIAILLWLTASLSVIGQNSTFMRLAKVPGLNFGMSFTETADGGMIGTGQDDGAGGHGDCDLYVHKIDECGVTQWYKRYGGGGSDGGKFVIQLTGGGYAVAGLCASSGAGSYDLWLLRLDGSGNLLWSKTFGTGAGEHGRCVAQASNGDLLLCGFRSGNRPVMYRVDINGTIVWQKEFDLNNGICNYVEFFPNGDILALGDFVGPYGGRDVFMARLDGSANLIWAQQLGTSGDDGIDWDVAGKIGGDGFILSATMSGFGTDQDMTISRFDGNGSLEWRKRLYGAAVDKAHFVNQTDDGGYVQSGTTNSWGFGDYDVMVNRFDADGNHLWSRIYGGTGIDKGWGVQQTSDNGYLLSTLTTSFGAMYYDPMFIKTDSIGELVNCPNFQTPPVTVADANYSMAALSFNVYDVSQFTGDYLPSEIDNVPDEVLVCFSCVNQPQFIISDSVLCEGESLYLVNQTTVGLICSQEWFIEDSSGANVLALPGSDTAVYSFSDPGFYYIILNADCGGIVNADTLTIIVLPKPEVGFEFADACLNGQPITLTDTSLVYPILWNWDFGDGSSGIGATVQHSYADSGSYDIQLAVTNFFQCSDTLVQQIRIHDKPTADFSFNDTCFGGPTNLLDQTVANEGSVVSYQWDLGDGDSDTQQNPSHTYANAGTFAVELIATTDYGCADTVQHDVNSYVLPQADFTLPVNCLNDPMPLQDASIAGDWPLSGWTWNLDSTTLTGTSVQHLFPTAGDYPVQLLVVDQFGCSDSLTQTVTVSVRPDIAVAVSDDCEDELFEFNNTSSIANGTIDSTHWDMGDGNTYISVSPVHVYTDHAVYDVTLYMESNMGCGSDTAFQVEVFPNPTAALQWSNVCDGTIVPLNELSSVPLPGILLLSDWNMGDGTIIVDSTLVGYQYAAFGAYSVQLSVETQQGCTDVAVFPVFVHPVPVADFSFTDICETDSVLIADQSNVAQGSIATWSWNLGNGQTFAQQDPPYQVYPADGFYELSLTVVSDSSCQSQLTDTIEIFPSPLANFSFDSVCDPLPVQFIDLSDPNGSYPLTQWSWTFTDGQVSNVQSPLINFLQYGSYGATLLVTNQAGCKNELTLGDALVHPLPVADFEAEMHHCLQDTMTLHDLSTYTVLSDDNIVDWRYTLGDGSSILLPEGEHVYGNPGFYPLQLLVTTNHGCQDSVLRQVEVYPLPEVDFEADPKEGCLPLFVQFNDQSTILSSYVLGQWQWDLGDSTAYPAIPSPSYVYGPQNLAPNDAATYDVNLTVTSTNGCVSSMSYPDLITVHPVPNALFSTDPHKTANILRPIFELTDLSSENVVSWQWTFGDGTNSSVQNPEHAYPDTGTYQIELIVETGFSCADTVSYTVNVEPNFSFYIPDAFSPNADRINDQFFGTGQYIIEYHMQIFDRWGEMIFESNDEHLTWNGTYKGAQVEAGQYIYKFYIVDWQGHDHKYPGSVMLVR